MSARPPRYPPPKQVAQEEPEDEEEPEDGEDGEDFDDEVDMFDALGSLLATEEGETIAMTLVGLKDATEKLALNMEMQNKILVKIVAALTKAAPPTPTIGTLAPA